jgi:hypothetical protein
MIGWNLFKYFFLIFLVIIFLKFEKEYVYFVYVNMDPILHTKK